ncbi:DUF302 domain-containing protein [Candidatus Woesearchaeota archaeon]|nr:DUF302 domain-containing protein [Candidatus Woesearchaeota archaeon]
MNLSDFAYVVETTKRFDEAVVSVLKAIDKKGWALFQVYDVQERLAAKGFPLHKLKIIEICNAKHAHQFLTKNPLVSLCLPCKINVFEKEGKVVICGMLPVILPQFFPEISPEETKTAEQDVKEIIDLSAEHSYLPTTTITAKN